MKLLKLVKNNVLSVFSPKTIVYVILIFTCINYIDTGLYGSFNLDNVIELSFYGVNKISDPLIRIFKMLSINIFPIYITLSYFNVNIDNYNLLTITRLKSKILWLNSIFVSTFVVCSIYYVIAFIVLFILNFKLILTILNFEYYFKVLILLILSNFSICLISMLLNSLIKNKAFIVSLIFFFYLLSIGIGDLINNSDKWLIFNQSMLVKHSNLTLTFCWSYYFNIVTSFVFYILIKLRIINKN